MISSSGGSKIAPMCLGMVLADAIWHDPSSGKRTILGTFSTIVAGKFPAAHPIMAIYCLLTDGYGSTNVCLKLVDENDEENAIVQANGVVNFDDPRAIVEMDFHFPGVVFPRAGGYRFQLWAADEFLLERRLLVIDIENEEQQNG